MTPSWFGAAMEICLAEAAGQGKTTLPPTALAVGCSGGPDSMALTCLLQRWAGPRSLSLTALIVDHGLRAEASEEAARVAGWLAARGVSAEILTHRGEKPRSNIQAAARRLRYDLMRDWCIAHDVPMLAVAHHLEDQAETFLLRLARGSGVDGLSAMAPVAALPGDPYRRVNLIRPLLDIAKADIHAVLTASDWPFVEDPSNRDLRHARVRMRNLAGALAMEGLDPARLARTARSMRRARQALEAATRDFLSAHAFLDAFGYGGIDRAALVRAGDEIALRALTRLLQLVSGGDYPFRLNRLEKLVAALRSDAPPGPRTLAGCRVETRGGTVFVFREAAAIGLPVPATETLGWDNRFTLALFGNIKGLTVGFLGADGVRQARARGLADDRFEAAPGPARAALPALWRGADLVAIGCMPEGSQGGGLSGGTGDAGFLRADFEGAGGPPDAADRPW